LLHPGEWTLERKVCFIRISLVDISELSEASRVERIACCLLKLQKFKVTAIVVNPPGRKLAKHTSVQCPKVLD
jgi:hypothetical protein